MKETLFKLKNKIRESENIPADRKQEYYELLDRLDSEVNELGKTDQEKAESISGFTRLSAHETTRREVNPNLLTIAADGLSESVKEFEASHPRLVSTVNDFLTFLSKIGI